MIVPIQYIEPKIKLIQKFRRFIKWIAIILLAIAFVLLIPFFSISDNNPDLKALWLFEFQAKVTFKILFLGGFIGIIAYGIYALNTRKIFGTIEVIDNKIIFNIASQKIVVDINNVLSTQLLFESIDENDVSQFKVVFKLKQPEKHEHIFYFIDSGEENQKFLSFLKNEKKLKVDKF